jgi:hypothetical protein
MTESRCSRCLVVMSVPLEEHSKHDSEVMFRADRWSQDVGWAPGPSDA